GASGAEPARRRRLAAIGFAGGLLGSLLGVGGGFVMVPLQVLWAKVAQHRANGTALAIIVPIALAGVPVYALAGGEVDFRLAAPLAVGGVFGAYLGARAVARLPELTLQRIVAVVLLIAGLKQLVVPG
ncbi:MAG: sulfite exporter TauE/SafE family protein, partial [Actinomycetota bacterium]|nr:sulfite exporter TauE/SafE family protein [Actinomycetota bacterium]